MIEPDVHQRRARVSSSRPGTGRALRRGGHRLRRSCRTTTAARPAARCAACTIRSSRRRASWSASPRARSSTWRWTSAGARPPSAAGSRVTLSDREPPPALDPARLRPRLLRAERVGRLDLQVHRLLRSGSTTARSAGTTPTSAIAWPLAGGGAAALGQGRRRARLPRRAESTRESAPRAGRALVTGAGGQLGLALQATAPPVGGSSPATPRQLDVTRPDARWTRCVRPRAARRWWSTPPPTPRSTRRNGAERAEAVNSAGAATWPRPPSRPGRRLIHVSTDFVFDGTQGRPYAPDDRHQPPRRLRPDQARGRARGDAHPRGVGR